MAAVGVALAAPAVSQAQTVTISGSTTVYPLAVDVARAYNRRNGTNFRILQGGSDVGVADVAAGRVSIGLSSRDPRSGDPSGITFYRVARDALCVVTNNAQSGVRNLSRAQVQAIYSQSVTDFSSVPGGRAGTITPYARLAAGGTDDAFRQLFLNPAQQGNVSFRPSNGTVAQAVRGNPNGVGYVSLPFTRGLNAVGYQGVACSLRNAKSNQYPGTRNLYAVTRGRARGSAAGFIRFWRSRAAAGIVSRNYVPVR